ncbi:MAG: biotin-dependent carboxyltransferase [Acidobacteria bacterium]|nr:biotin-dependent carboxyltransferase [Acidobacteriota bacterium]
MTLLFQKEGIFSSLQNLRGIGRQSFGINPRGPMDRFAARVANLLAGNDEDGSVLEMHFPAAQIEFGEDCRFALAGADFAAALNGIPARNWAAHSARSHDVLKFEGKVFGSRSYLAIEGGMKTDRAGYSTIRLAKGSIVEREAGNFIDCHQSESSFVSKSILPAYSSFPTVRVLPGGEFGLLSDAAIRALTSEPFVLSNESDRMGYRLDGPVLSATEPAEMVSAAVTFGTIQLPPDGQPIVLMADHQTSGGYPRVANVISADLPLLGQLGPQDKVSFQLANIEEAERAAMQMERNLKKLRTGIRFGRFW